MQPTTTDRQRLFGIYLDDHRAGAAGGVALAHRMLEENPDNYLTVTMRELTGEIEQDVQLLDDIIVRLGHSPNRLKIAMGTLSSWVGRLKANGYVRRYSPLSRLEEFEMLAAGIMSKASLWRNCELALAEHPEVGHIDFSKLRQQAVDQHLRLERHRERIVADAFG